MESKGSVKAEIKVEDDKGACLSSERSVQFRCLARFAVTAPLINASQ